ncbi:MAG: hypothetical protein AAGE83_00040 [Pseudomonadota bacterium]
MPNAAYEARCGDIHDAALAIAARLPNPAGLDAQALGAAAEADAPAGEVLSVVRLFQWFLPGLALNVAFLRWQLGGS